MAKLVDRSSPLWTRRTRKPICSACGAAFRCARRGAPRASVGGARSSVGSRWQCRCHHGSGLLARHPTSDHSRWSGVVCPPPRSPRRRTAFWPRGWLADRSWPRRSLEVLNNDQSSFSTALRRGRATFEVHPGGPRRWTVEGGLATIEVVGTEFTLERGPESAGGHRAPGRGAVRGEHVPDRVQKLLPAVSSWSMHPRPRPERGDDKRHRDPLRRRRM